ncbi:MAG: 6-phosphogluconolactonase [Nitrospirota bacterium]
MIPGEQPQVRVFPDSDIMSRAAAEHILKKLKNILSFHDRVAVALSGGSTPKKLYTLLGSADYPFSDWSKVHFFWADERCVPPDHPESNFKYINDTFLSPRNIPHENIHRIKGELGPDQAAKEYEREIRSFFKITSPVFDLIILGAGADGHTASLFPGSTGLHERDHVCIPVRREPIERDRVTLTLAVLNAAEEVIFLATGMKKAAAVKIILEQGNHHAYPAGLVKPMQNCFWFLDKEAASHLHADHESFPKE